MKRNVITKIVAFGGVAVLTIGALTGCGKSAEISENVEETAEAVIAEEPVALADTVAQAPYLTKGVYVNYAEGATTRDYFYVFYDENTGYTEDGNTGTGVPFSCEQTDGKIEFSFGGEDEQLEVFEVTSTENGIITGHFDDGIVLNFDLKMDADADNFNAQNYVSPSTEAVYESANGWTVKYNSDLIAVNESANLVTFVYTGESAGTNMVTVTYDVGKSGKEAIDEMAESWGSESVMRTEGLFPGTEDVDGYWAVLPPAEGGSGLYETAIGRDYMDGYLVFELTGHNSGDDALDMQVSDTMAMIIDSLEFVQY